MVITRSSSESRFFIPVETAQNNTRKSRNVKNIEGASNKFEVLCNSECEDSSAGTPINARNSTVNPSVMSNLSLPTAPFSSKDPEGWFRQLEAIFNLSKIEDDATKYVHLQARMDPLILRDVSKFFANEPATDKYKSLNGKIIAKYSVPRDAQVLQLLEGLSLGNRRPSELLGEIQRLASTDVSENVMRTIFVKKLPETIGSILVGSGEQLQKLGELADKIYAFHINTQQPQIAAYAAPPSSSVVLPRSIESEITQIKAMLSSFIESNINLTTRVATLEAGLHSTRSSRSSQRNRSPSPMPRRRSLSRGGIPEDSKLCYYHYKFMGKAKNCKSLPDGTLCKWNNLNA